MDLYTVVQLDPEKTTNPAFKACLLIVTEVKKWGVQGYVQSLGKDGEIGGQFYYRAEHGTYSLLEEGRAPWMVL